MLQKIKQQGQVNLFIFVYNVSSGINSTQIENLALYKRLLGIENQCWNQIAFALTFCDYDSSDFKTL